MVASFAPVVSDVFKFRLEVSTPIAPSSLKSSLKSTSNPETSSDQPDLLQSTTPDEFVSTVDQLIVVPNLLFGEVNMVQVRDV